jgi:hypothetical protein
MSSDRLPDWLARRLHMLTRIGHISLLRERHVDLMAFSHPGFRAYCHIVKTLDLTGSDISSLAGLPVLPRLTSLILNQSGLATLTNIMSLPKLRMISLKKTPFSEIPHYKISLLIGVGAEIVKINDQAITDVLRSRVQQYPSCAQGLVNAGWIAEYPRPSSAQFTALCAEYDVPDSNSVGSSGCDEIDTERDVQMPNDFNALAEQLLNDHEHLLHKKQALFGIVEEMGSEDEAMDECRVRVGELFRERGIAVDVNDDDAVLQMIDDLCSGRLPT